MNATDVSDTLRMALAASGLDQAHVRRRPRLLSDNGPSYISAQLGSWLEDNGMAHTRGRPNEDRGSSRQASQRFDASLGENSTPPRFAGATLRSEHGQ